MVKLLSRRRWESGRTLCAVGRNGAPRPRALPVNKLVVQLTNARSVLPKLPEILHDVSTGRSPDVIAVTESWLKDSVPDGALSLPGYDIHRRDRRSRRGGGVLLWTSSALKFVHRLDLQEWQEDLWVELSCKSCRPLIIACVYRSPHSQIHDFCDALETSLSRVDLRSCDVLVLGDFNATLPRWLSSDPLSDAGTVLEPTALQLGLQQLVSVATHLHSDGSLGSCIDLIFTSSPQCCQAIKTLPPLGSSDHVRIECSLHLQPSLVQGSARLRRI